MTEVNFFQSWAFTFIVGIISFAAGFALAIIMAGGGRGSRMEEKDVFRADVPPFETPEEIVEREKRKKAYLAILKKRLETETITQGKPEDD